MVRKSCRPRYRDRGPLIRSQSPYMQMRYVNPQELSPPVCGEGEYTDTRLFDDTLRWPLTQRAILNVPAGEVVNFHTARRVPICVYVTVITGCLDLFLDPANPTVDQPDWRFAKDVKPNELKFSPGSYKFYIFAGDNRPLQATVMFVDRE